MKFSSFRSRIIVSLIVLIATVSFVVFFAFNNLLSDKIYKDAESNIESVMEVLKTQYYSTIEFHDKKTINSMMKKMDNNKLIIRTFLINSDGEILYPKQQNKKILKFDINRLDAFSSDIKIESLQNDSIRYLRAYLRLEKELIHQTTNENIAYIISDFPIVSRDKNLLYILLFSLLFTAIMIGVIVFLIFLMHYKFIKKSLSDFQYTINIINKGDLSKRIIIPKSKELGNLAKSFNEMLETFQQTQQELQEIHNKKIKNSKKLATIGEMSARLAHEIRNPIMGIANAAEIIINDITCQQDKSILEEIKRQADRVNNAVTDLLKYSRSAKLNLEEQNINDLIASLVSFLENQQTEDNIIIQTKLQDKIPEFEFDYDQLESILLEIIYNAKHAIGKNGSILLQTIYKNNFVEISIKDTGTGMSDEELQEIFNPFYTTRTEGTGLGLAIAKDMIEKHSGIIRAESTKGQGSIFYIELPVNKK